MGVGGWGGGVSVCEREGEVWVSHLISFLLSTITVSFSSNFRYTQTVYFCFEPLLTSALGKSACNSDIFGEWGGICVVAVCVQPVLTASMSRVLTDVS